MTRQCIRQYSANESTCISLRITKEAKSQACIYYVNHYMLSLRTDDVDILNCSLILTEVETAMNLTIPHRVTPSTSPLLTSPMTPRNSFAAHVSPGSSRASSSPEPEKEPNNRDTTKIKPFRPWLSVRDVDDTDEKRKPDDENDRKCTGWWDMLHSLQ